MSRPYTRGLHDLGDGLYAYLIPDGGWGLSNAGIVTAGGGALFIDTLTDRPSIEAMIEAFRDVAGPDARVETVLNTHSDPDHTMGNEYFPESEIIASIGAKAEIEERLREPRAAKLAAMAARGDDAPLRFYNEVMRAVPLDRAGLSVVPPRRTFSGTLTLEVGGIEVRLIELGTAHSGGDVIAHVPSARTVFTGDLLFSNGHPVLGSRSSAAAWIAACTHILELQPEVVVPGHGPVAGPEDVRRTRDYFSYLRSEVARAIAEGVPPAAAVKSISLAAYRDWNCSERVVANVLRLYEELAGVAERADDLELFGAMYHYVRERAA